MLSAHRKLSTLPTCAILTLGVTGFAYAFSHLDASKDEEHDEHDDDDDEDDDEDYLDSDMPSDKKEKKVKLTPEEKAASKHTARRLRGHGVSVWRAREYIRGL